MSRSKHTRPYHIRAAERVRAPHEPRGRGDNSAKYTEGRALKELGIVVGATKSGREGDEALPQPRLVAKRSRHGRFHPLTKRDIIEALDFFGESCVYGLRSISLVSGANLSTARDIVLGAYVAPGRVLLFDQPPSPWQLAGTLSETEVQRLHRAGADVDVPDGGLLTIVTWPGETLRRFVLFDGLMHEIGHHILQHSKGKRNVRVLRTKDHEQLADQFANKCRLLSTVAEFET